MVVGVYRSNADVHAYRPDNHYGMVLEHRENIKPEKKQKRDNYYLTPNFEERYKIILCLLIIKFFTEEYIEKNKTSEEIKELCANPSALREAIIEYFSSLETKTGYDRMNSYFYIRDVAYTGSKFYNYNSKENLKWNRAYYQKYLTYTQDFKPAKFTPEESKELKYYNIVYANALKNCAADDDGMSDDSYLKNYFKHSKISIFFQEYNIFKESMLTLLKKVTLDFKDEKLPVVIDNTTIYNDKKIGKGVARTEKSCIDPHLQDKENYKKTLKILSEVGQIEFTEDVSAENVANVENVSAANISVENVGEANVGVENVGVENVSAANVGVENVGVENVGAANISEANIDGGTRRRRRRKTRRNRKNKRKTKKRKTLRKKRKTFRRKRKTLF
jgi:hypothetical protein